MLDVFARDLGNAESSDDGAERAFGLRTILCHGAGSHAANADSLGGEFAKEPIQALGDGRRSCSLFAPAERVSLAGPNGSKLGARTFAHRLEADFRAPGERCPTVSTSSKVVVQNVRLRAGRCDANAESLHGFVPQDDRLRTRLRASRMRRSVSPMSVPVSVPCQYVDRISAQGGARKRSSETERDV